MEGVDASFEKVRALARSPAVVSEGLPVGLSMAERKAVTKQMALRYRQASKADKTVMLGELFALTGWHCDYARRALRTVAARPSVPRRTKRAVPVRKPRPPVYDEAVIDVLRVVWALLDFSCGKRLAT